MGGHREDDADAARGDESDRRGADEQAPTRGAPFELGADLVETRPPGGILRDARHEKTTQSRRDPTSAQLLIAGGELGLGIGTEGLDQGDTERVDVGRRRRGAAAPQLGRHVEWRAAHIGDPHHGRSGRVEPREAEVADPDASIVADEDVGGLEVAVDDAAGVGGGEAVAGLGEHGQDLVVRAGGREPRGEIGARDVLHHHEDRGAIEADLVDGHHVRVGEARHHARLLQQRVGARARRAAVQIEGVIAR